MIFGIKIEFYKSLRTNNLIDKKDGWLNWIFDMYSQLVTNVFLFFPSNHFSFNLNLLYKKRKESIGYQINFFKKITQYLIHSTI